MTMAVSCVHSDGWSYPTELNPFVGQLGLECADRSRTRAVLKLHTTALQRRTVSGLPFLMCVRGGGFFRLFFRASASHFLICFLSFLLSSFGTFVVFLLRPLKPLN